MGLLSGLFGSSKQESSIPDWVRQPAQQNIQNAQRIAGMGYTPYYGPDVAAMTPMQEAAMRNTGQAMSAFGMEAPANPMAGMPQAQTFAGGVRGYSSGPMYDQALAALKQKNPAQYNAIMQMMQQFRQQGQPQQAANPMTAQSLAEYLRMGGDPRAIRPGMFSRGSDGGGSSGPSHSGGSANALMSYLPGGVNTANPASRVNQAIGVLTNNNSTPTQSDRPKANPRR